MKKTKSLLLAALTVAAMMFTACVSTDADGVDPAITKGINAWNSREPEAAKAYWEEIEDSADQKRYLNYITLYDAGVEALDSTDSIKSTNESKLLSACNTALTKFSGIDENALELPADVAEKGANLTAARVTKLLESEKVSDAKKMYNTAVKVYGSNDALDEAGKEVTVVSSIISKRADLKAKSDKAGEIEDLDEKIEAYNKLMEDVPSIENEVNADVKKSGVGSAKAVAAAQKSFKKTAQDVSIQRAAAIREKAYDYKEQIGEVFARQMEGKGSGKNGAYTNQDILDHYNSVKTDMQTVYAKLLDFQKQYPTEIDQNVIDDINDQKVTLESKIAMVEKEIAKEKEIASRGKYIGMIGLFNAEAGDAKKSKPAKFSGSTAKTEDYLWGIVDIPAGSMNDLVITMKDNRTIHVYNQNTKSGKQIEKLGLKDLISKQNKVGNSWPVMNAREALKGSIYYVQVEQGKAADYSGEAVVYASFITRSR